MLAQSSLDRLAPVRALLLGIAVTGVALAIALSPIDLAVAVVGGAIALVVVIVRPTWGLALLAFSVPYESIRQLEAGGFNVGSTEVLVALTGLAWGLRLLATRQPFTWPKPAWGLVALIGVGALSVITAANPLLSLKEGLKWAELLVVWVVGANVLGGARAGQALVAALLLAGISQTLIAYAQFLLQLGPPAFRFGAFLRAFGTFSQPNPFAGYLITLAPLAFALTLFGWRGWRDAARRETAARSSVARGAADQAWRAVVGFGVAYVLLIGALATTLSRGAWLGFALGSLVILVIWNPRVVRHLALLAGVAFLITIAGVANLLPEAVAERLSDAIGYFGVFNVNDIVVSARNWPLVERMAHWQSGWEMFTDRPLIGVGLGNYPVVYLDYQQTYWRNAGYFKDPLGHAHNLYINILAEVGVVGLVSYLAYWLGVITVAVRASRRGAASNAVGLAPRPARTSNGVATKADDRAQAADWWPQAIAVGVLGALVAVSTHNYFDNLTVHGLNVQIAMLLSLLYAQLKPVGRASEFPR